MRRTSRRWRSLGCRAGEAVCEVAMLGTFHRFNLIPLLNILQHLRECQYRARSSLQQSRNIRGRKIHPSTGSRRGATAAVRGGPSWGFKGLTKHYWNSVDTQLLFIPERGLTRVETILGLNQYSRQSTQFEPVTCDH